MKTKKIRLSIFATLLFIIVAGVFVTVRPVRTTMYYMLLTKPTLSEEQVICTMSKSKGLLNNADKSLIKAVQWYVYHGDERVVLQLFHNLKLEVAPIAIQDNGKMMFGINNTKGLSYSMVSNQPHLFRVTNEVAIKELFRLSINEDLEPVYLHVLINVIGQQPSQPVWYKKEQVGWQSTPEKRKQFQEVILTLYEKYFYWDSIRNDLKRYLGSEYDEQLKKVETLKSS